MNDRYLEVRVLRIGSRWADQSHPIIVASSGGGNKPNRGLSGLFKIFLKNFLFKSSQRTGVYCNKNLAHSILTATATKCPHKSSTVVPTLSENTLTAKKLYCMRLTNVCVLILSVL